MIQSILSTSIELETLDNMTLNLSTEIHNYSTLQTEPIAIVDNEIKK